MGACLLRILDSDYEHLRCGVNAIIVGASVSKSVGVLFYLLALLRIFCYENTYILSYNYNKSCRLFYT